VKAFVRVCAQLAPNQLTVAVFFGRVEFGGIEDKDFGFLGKNIKRAFIELFMREFLFQN
jgi:hypothetical protein